MALPLECHSIIYLTGALKSYEVGFGANGGPLAPDFKPNDEPAAHIDMTNINMQGVSYTIDIQRN